MRVSSLLCNIRENNRNLIIWLLKVRLYEWVANLQTAEKMAESITKVSQKNANRQRLQHLERMGIHGITKQAQQYKPKGRRNIGQQGKRWKDLFNLERTAFIIRTKCTFLISTNINPLKTKRRLLYLKTQFVPRSKHFSSRL